MAKSKNKIVFKRHKFWFVFYRPVVKFIALLKHYKAKGKFNMKKGESYVILSNHQTDLDGLLTLLSFNRPAYGVVTDSFMSKGFVAKMFKHQLGLIPKKKGVLDIKANMDMVRCIHEGGSLLLFPEGNRTYAEYEFPFSEGFAKFVRFFKKPIVLFNIHGGCGVFPRFAKERRKGPYYGEIKRVLEYEEYKDWSDDKLTEVIRDNLRVYDSESGQLYKSDTRAEHIERMFFVCPKCGAIQTLNSEGNFVECSNCGLKVEFTEDLHLRSDDKEFKYTKLIEWYNYQIRFIKDMKISGGKPIFIDHNVGLYRSKVGVKRKLLVKGDLVLSKDTITFGDKVFNLSEIEIASPISGTKFNFSTNDDEYLVIGDDRFNPLKYVLMFHKLDTKMKQNNMDIYYTLDEREE